MRGVLRLVMGCKATRGCCGEYMHAAALGLIVSFIGAWHLPRGAPHMGMQHFGSWFRGLSSITVAILPPGVSHMNRYSCCF